MTCNELRPFRATVLVALPEASKAPLKLARTPPTVRRAVNDPVLATATLIKPELAFDGELDCSTSPAYVPSRKRPNTSDCWSIVKVLPSTEIVPVRAAPLVLAVTEKEIVPLPKPLLVEVIVIQSTELMAVQGQLVISAVTVNAPASTRAGSVT